MKKIKIVLLVAFAALLSSRSGANAEVAAVAKAATLECPAGVTDCVLVECEREDAECRRKLEVLGLVPASQQTAPAPSAVPAAQAQAADRESNWPWGAIVLLVAVVGGVLIGAIYGLCRWCCRGRETAPAPALPAPAPAVQPPVSEAERRERERQEEEQRRQRQAAAEEAETRRRLEDALIAARILYERNPSAATEDRLTWAEIVLARHNQTFHMDEASVSVQVVPGFGCVHPSPFFGGEDLARQPAPAAATATGGTPPASSRSSDQTGTRSPATADTPRRTGDRPAPAGEPDSGLVRETLNLLNDLGIQRDARRERILRETGVTRLQNASADRVRAFRDRLREEVRQRGGGGGGGEGNGDRPMSQGQLEFLRRLLGELGMASAAEQDAWLTQAFGVPDQEQVTHRAASEQIDRLRAELAQRRAGGGSGNGGGQGQDPPADGAGGGNGGNGGEGGPQ